MDREIQNSSRKSAEVQKLPADENIELWEPPFDRWLKLTDDLLRNWPRAAAIYRERL